MIEQVLETDFLVSATAEEKLPGNIKKVGQKVFLERRPERDTEISEAQEEERSQARIVYLKVFYLKELSLTKKFKFTLV